MVNSCNVSYYVSNFNFAQARLQYDDYAYDIPGSAPSSSSSSSSLFKSESAIYGSYAGMAMGVCGGILLLAIIIYALVVNSRKKESTYGQFFENSFMKGWI